MNIDKVNEIPKTLRLQNFFGSFFIPENKNALSILNANPLCFPGVSKEFSRLQKELCRFFEGTSFTMEDWCPMDSWLQSKNKSMFLKEMPMKDLAMYNRIKMSLMKKDDKDYETLMIVNDSYSLNLSSPRIEKDSSKRFFEELFFCIYQRFLFNENGYRHYKLGRSLCRKLDLLCIRNNWKKSWQRL